MMLGLGLALVLAAQQAPALTSYEEMVRCAGLTQAASELAGGEGAEAKALMDAALYWSLTALQAATAAGKSPTVAEADQTRARIQSVRLLSSGAPEARAVLQTCRQRVPDLG